MAYREVDFLSGYLARLFLVLIVLQEEGVMAEEQGDPKLVSSLEHIVIKSL